MRWRDTALIEAGTIGVVVGDLILARGEVVEPQLAHHAWQQRAHAALRHQRLHLTMRNAHMEHTNRTPSLISACRHQRRHCG
jgi:hypothetical protein